MSKKVRVGLLTALAIAALLFAAAAVVARARPISNIPDLVLAVGSPYVALVALAGLIVASTAKRTTLSVFAVVVIAAALAVQVSWYYLGQRPTNEGQHVDIRVLSSNLRYGQADPSFFVKLAEQNADVITAAELTPEAVQRFTQTGIDKTFPYSSLIPAPRAGGVGMWSRYPLTTLSVARHRGISIPAVRLEVPGVATEPVLASVHVYSPVAGENNTDPEWRNGMAGATAQLANFAQIAGPGAVIVGGDYNSTPDMRQFRDLLTDGYRDAVEQLGAGFAPTFPSNSWYPPLLTIDHVLTRNAAASSIRTIEVPGSDHRALLATFEVPAG
ncbi:endonuclease/exonuclease/phosphatase family protein [Candidatus Mycolicibacterium alkanivorans]|uniref:Endonuclease/exonuclease/phosphatase family protein n=1 Tax=Candidatus Mycolicibacterium alkanivorans TaxID=2954114 RepID=A0ABS9YSV1_9MYCO|nr:endonuclease/exonuclease/phosphatase family protein [Candidatus Mycolicibacterium alkanivorans]MCI4673464.1 endonuclease/exonuclease/phosphatase family protein [Candidatus Mycolicibacterium alkanivorans]